MEFMAEAMPVVAASVIWAALGIYVSVTDIRGGIVPRRAVWPAGLAVAALLCTAALIAGNLSRFAWALIGAASVAAFFEVVYRTRPQYVGYGDVRLIIVNSILAGWWGVQWAWWALLAGAVAAWPAALLALQREGRGASVRWAPGLVVGTAAVVAFCLWSFGPGS